MNLGSSRSRKSTLVESLSRIWLRFYGSLLNLVFYLPCGGEDCFRKRCVNFASPAEGDQVLDVCCGAGELTYLIAERMGLEGKVIGVDIWEPALEMARMKPRNLPVTFLGVNAEKLPFASSKFDKCFISLGLHHMPEQTRHNTLNEIRRTLKSTGSLFIVEYNLPAGALDKLTAKVLVRLDKSKEAYNMWINHSVLREIGQAGFSIKRREFICKGVIQLVEARNKASQPQ